MTPLWFSVRSTLSYWNIISKIKHPIMKDRLSDVVNCLMNPDEIRISKTDAEVYLFYQLVKEGRFICAVVKHVEYNAFLITAYPTNNIKEGSIVWKI